MIRICIIMAMPFEFINKSDVFMLLSIIISMLRILLNTNKNMYNADCH